MSPHRFFGSAAHPGPAHPYPTDNGTDDKDLDARIHAAELAVIERDERVQYNVREVFGHMRRHVGASLAVGAGVLLLAGLLRGRRHGKDARARSTRAPAPNSPLIYALGLLWPLLPEKFRRVVPRGVSEMLLGTVVPALGQWVSRRRKRTSVDAAKTGARGNGRPDDGVVSGEL